MVRPAEPWRGHLPAQHCQLVAQHEYLGVPCQSVHPVDAEELNGAIGRGGRGTTGPRASSMAERARPWSNPTSSFWTPQGSVHPSCIRRMAPTGSSFRHPQVSVAERVRQGWSPLPGACPGPGAAPELGPQALPDPR